MEVKASSTWTAANLVTMARICLVPLWLLFAETTTLAGDSFSLSAFLSCVFFILISLSDSIDGYLARSRDEVTTLGKFLDPIADKLVVVAGLIFLIERSKVASWVLIVIVGREFLVSALRMLVATNGTVIAASNLGKIKTATTMLALVGLLLVCALPQNALSLWLSRISQLALYVAVFFTIWSGVDYFLKSRSVLE